MRAVPSPPLLPFAAQVEERVVDADGHADEQDHGFGHVRRRQHVAQELVQPDGAEHGGEGEQHGDAGRHQRPEGEDRG